MKNVLAVRIGDNTVIDYKGDPTVKKDCGIFHIVDSAAAAFKNAAIPANTKIA
ncbi:MAG: hypothetical protein NT166_09950 [Candidatus Aminicenantes bacterium]|nr:hypothetical protein [Candidatus Aminicenantes bacterium]